MKYAITTAVAAAALALSMSASAGQPHMEAALKHLEQAKTELQAASPDKGGMREHAIESVDKAIMQTKKGMVADAANVNADEQAKRDAAPVEPAPAPQ